MARAVKITAVWLGAAVVLLVGLGLWQNSAPLAESIANWASVDQTATKPVTRGLAVALIGLALLAFVRFVADDLFPLAPQPMRGFIKTFIAVIVGGAVLWGGMTLLGLVW